MFNLLLKIDKTWDFLVEPPNINHWKNFFLIHILEKTLLVFPRWVPNIHLVEFQPNRRFCYDLIPAPCVAYIFHILLFLAHRGNHFTIFMSYTAQPKNLRQYTRGPDEVIAKSLIWLKLYQMNIWNPSRKDKKSFLQNMN